MKLGLKLLSAFLLIASLVGMVNYLTSFIYREVLVETGQVCRSSLHEIMEASEMALAIHASQIAAYKLINDKHEGPIPSPIGVEALDDKTGKRQVFQNSLQTFEQWLSVSKHRLEIEARSDQPSNDADKTYAAVDRLANLSNEYARHAKVMDRYLKFVIDGNVAEAHRFLKTEVETHFDDKLLPLVRTHQGMTKEVLVNMLIDADYAISTTNNRSLLITVIAFVLASIMGLVIAHSIATPINALKEAALRIGNGDLDTDIQVVSSGEIGILANTFQKMAKRLKSTTVSKVYVNNILQSMEEMLVVTDAQGCIETVNHAALEELGYSEKELLGQSVTLLFPSKQSLPTESKSDNRAIDGAIERMLLTKSGAEIPVQLSSSLLMSANGDHGSVVYVAKNIVEQKRVEAQMLTSLNEKKVLLREIHHRVKNNLQIISSLLNLQAMRADYPEVKHLFRKSENQIRSMALIHEQLYLSQDLARIKFDQYVDSLIGHLEHSYGREARNIILHIDVDPVQLSIDEAITIGLLINELVSNAMKHAFSQNQGGDIWISFKMDEKECTLSVRDNGIGLTESSADDANNKTLGMDLVNALVKQLDANLEVGNQHGTQFVITFEDASTKEHSATTA